MGAPTLPVPPKREQLGLSSLCPHDPEKKVFLIREWLGYLSAFSIAFDGNMSPGMRFHFEFILASVALDKPNLHKTKLSVVTVTLIPFGFLIIHGSFQLLPHTLGSLLSPSELQPWNASLVAVRALLGRACKTVTPCLAGVAQ